MFAIALISFGLGLALILALAFGLGRAGVAPDSSSILGIGFSAPDLTRRPRGVQEEDLPRFVFTGETSAAFGPC